jgi:hypothetical protein
MVKVFGRVRGSALRILSVLRVDLAHRRLTDRLVGTHQFRSDTN